MKKQLNHVRYSGTHMTGVAVSIYGTAPDRHIQIKWDGIESNDPTLYHENELEPVEKRTWEPSRLYGSDWGKLQREQARLRDAKEGYVSLTRKR